MDARAYWTRISQNPGITAAKLRPDGRERLDAIGAIKRFSDVAEQRDFPSTSTVASRPFLEKACGLLADYRKAVKDLLGQHLHKTQQDKEWPYDGDLLFAETLKPRRLEASYGLQNPDPEALKAASEELRKLYKRVGSEPSPYYSVIVLDGDDMGKRFSQRLDETAHRELSGKLAEFATKAKDTIGRHSGSPVYSGGDDVLALAPLSTAFELAQDLTRSFDTTTEGTASAGLAIVHHLYPLGAALRAARAAERQAKQLESKAAACVRVIRRSGEAVEMRSAWSPIGDTFAMIVGLFQEDGTGAPLSSRLAYDVRQAAYALPKADAKSKAELKRLIRRHRNDKHPRAPDPESLAARLHEWATGLPCGMEELGRWLLFARFVAQGGSE